MRTISFISLPVLVAAILFGTSISIALNAYAQGLALRIQPSTIDERVDPGQLLEGEITVTNPNGSEQTYFISTRNITGMSDTGTPSFSNELTDDPLEAASWIKPFYDSVTLEGGQSRQVPYRIEVPENASPGSYFAAFFVTREAEETTQSGAGVGFHVASLVNLRVNGEADEDMLFREFFTGRSFFMRPDVLFFARIDNTGTIHQRPRGIITVSDMFGNDVGQVTFNDNAGAILPGHDRIFEVAWTNEELAFGRYTAVASVVFGETDKKTRTKEIHFWIFPMREMSIVFGVVALILLAFMYGVKRYIRNALARAGHTEINSVTERHVSFAERLLKTTVRLLVILVLLFIGIVVFFA